MSKKVISVKILQKEVSRLKKLVHHDQLSGLYNRPGFAEDVEGYLKELKGEHKKGSKDRRSFKIRNLSIIFADLNDFKKLNDRYGHACGDEVIKAFARILKKGTRSIDVAGRWSGDEFVVALVGADKKDAQNTVDKIRKIISEKIWRLCGKNGLKVSASFGCASVVDETRAPKKIFEMRKLIREADKQMYEDKKRQKSLFDLKVF